MTVPFGQITIYQDVVRAVSQPKVSQVVGNVNGSNPIAIIIPCHRIVSKNGQLTAGNLWQKEWLLGHEKDYLL